MKIQKTTIKNFRSIESVEISTTSFNILVGQNNCGKTNFFEAIEWFYNGTGKNQSIDDLKFFRKDALSIQVSIDFTDVQQGVQKMENEKNRETIRKIIGERNEVTVIRDSLDIKKRYFLIDGEKKGTGTGFDAALNDFLPKLEYVHTKQYHSEVAKYSRSTPIAVMLGGLLTEIMKENRQYKEFIEKFNQLFQSDDSEVSVKINELAGSVKIYLEKQFPDTTKVEFSLTPPQFDDLLKTFETGIDDGILTSADEKGDGMQRALMLAIIQTYADFRKNNDNSCKRFLFLIDEAELHLHPKAQRKLKNTLYELAERGDQVFINTHSSVLISDNEIDQKIFKVEKFEGVTSIEETNEVDKKSIVYDLLGGSPSDILYPSNIVLVEGPSEVELINRICSRFYLDKPRLQIIPARGDAFMTVKMVELLQKLYDALNNPIYKGKFVIILDKQPQTAEGAIKDFLAKNPDLRRENRYIEISEGSLEEYYPSPWKTKIESGNISQKKMKLAKKVGAEITKKQFELEMTALYQGMKIAWEKAHQ